MKKNNASSLSIQINKSHASLSWNLVPAGILLLAGFTGMLFQEWSLQEDGSPLAAVLLTAVLAFLVFSFLKRSRWTRLYVPVISGMILLTILSILILHKTYADSLGILLNRICSWLYLKTGVYHVPFSGSGSSLLILLLFSVYCGLLTEILTRILRGKLVLFSMIAAAFLLISGTFTPSAWVFSLFAGCVLTLAADADSIIRKHMLFTATGLALLCAVLVLIGIGTGELTAGGMMKDTDGALEDQILETVHRLRYEKNENAMPEGQLSGLAAWKPNGEAALSVTMEKWKSLYIRGFQGGNYTGSSWEPLSAEELDEEKELLYELQKDGLSATGQEALAWETVIAENGTDFLADVPSSDEQTEDASVTNTVIIQNTGACSKYEYVPYSSLAAEGSASMDAHAITSEGLVSSDRESESYTQYPLENSYFLMKELQNLSDTQYTQEEAAYRSFVYDHYLTIPNNVRSLLAAHSLMGTEGTPTIQACQEIRLLLKETLDYDEETVTRNGNTDFIEYLLDVDSRGYSVQYASLAVMMLRSYGIPARYAEGYLIPASQADDLTDGTTVTVTQNNSSAWAEYYLDGVGWIPFDPTPKYCDELIYNIPVGEGEGEAVPGNMGLTSDSIQSQQQKEHQQNESGQQSTEKKHTGVRPLRIFLILLIILIFLLAVLVLRTIILRNRLKMRRIQFADADHKKSAAAMICYARDLTCGAAGVAAADYLNDPDQRICEYLDCSEEELEEIHSISDGILFSRNSVSDENMETVRNWLNRSEAAWKQKTSLPKKIFCRYISCKVY